MKNNRLRLMFLGLAVVCLIASCNKNNGGNGIEGGKGFRAVIEQTSNKGSRTHIESTWETGSTVDIVWSEGDNIKVSNLGGGTGCATQTFQLVAGEGGLNGTFLAGEGNDDFYTPDYVAIYPAANAEGTANTLSGTTATFTLPATQQYEANSFAEKSMPMVAYASTQDLEFKNVLGGICFPILGDGLTVTRVVLTSANASDKLCGVFTADCNSATPTPTYVSGGGNAITLDCGTGVTLNGSTPTYFCIMVPPATLASGFTVAFYDGETELDSKTTSANPGITRSVISRVNQNLTLEVQSGPVGIINGKFTINADGDQVYFSKGNLQYTKSTGVWSFMEHQYDIVETNGLDIGTDYTNQDVISLFGWGTSGYHDASDPYNVNYQPWSTIAASLVNIDYNAYGYGPSTNMTDLNLTGTSANYDWGVYNPISNGGNAENSGWRTLTHPEWDYVFNTRSTTSGIRYAKASVNGVNGTIILPDNWTASIYALNNTNGDNYGSNTITAEDWANNLEANGAVFLPAAGYRSGTSVYDVGSYGYYWSSSYLISLYAYGVDFYSSYLSTDLNDRYYGQSVRLVCPAE